MAKIPGYVLTETLREDGEFVLSRGRRETDQAKVLAVLPVSDRPTPASLGRLEHEFALREELEPDWSARPLALEGPPGGRLGLVLEDPLGVSLGRLLDGPLELARFLRLAIAISGALARIHGKNLLHKDIKPANILMNPDTGEVHFTGFGIASRIPREHQAPDFPELIAGTLAYMAPEQTGRMNRSIDSRSDLYSLGVMFYEMLTGALPFAASEPLEWIHCHIARQPAPPEERVPGLPAPVSALVLKLLSKNAEDRYQTAAGLQADLRRCLEAWDAGGRIEPFPLGESDISDRLLIPEKLYGRERERRILQEAFDRVVAFGIPELVLVSGYAGVGKSTLVNELHKLVIPPRGLFASGKFDQYKRDIPYATLAQAFGSLVRLILGKSDQEVDRWRKAIQEAVGPNGRVVADLVPALGLVLGDQPPVPELSAQEAQNRFHNVVRRFLGVFARQEHPLTLFLDDLQWLDPATLRFLEHLVTHPEVRHLLLIGAYRDNEVTAYHPLTLTLEAIRKTGTPVRAIVLAPLSVEDLRRLLADALHRDPPSVGPLAWLLHEKTGGNPFFLIQFLTVLHEEGLLEFDTGSAAWRWDVERIRAKGITDNVVDLMIGKLKRLPRPAQEALNWLACLGNTADAGILTLVHGGSEEQVHAGLWEAVRQGLLIRTGDTYAFLHDRVREAAYALTAEPLRKAAHLRIGRLLLAKLPEEAMVERVFDLVNQFNRGLELLDDPGERDTIFRLDFLAGLKAKAATAYASARGYLAQALSLAPPDAWEERYGDIFALTLELAECEYLAGDFARADALFNLILGTVRTKVDRAKVASLRGTLYQVAGRFQEAAEVMLEALRYFDVTFPESEEEIAAAVAAELRNIEAHLGGRRIPDLVDAPLAADPEVRAIINLLGEANSCLYMAKNKIRYLATMKGIDYALRYGNTPEACVVYSSYAGILSAAFGEFQSALEYAELSLRLNEKLNDVPRRGVLLFQYATVIQYLRKPIASTRPLLERAFAACIDVGDFVYAGYTGIIAVWHLIEEGLTMDEVFKGSAKYLAFAAQSHSDTVHATIRQYLQFLACLRGATRGPTRFDDDTFDEEECLAFFAQTGHNSGIAYHHIMKEIACFLNERYDEALEAVSRTETVLHAATSLLIQTTHHFFHALILAALHPLAPAEQQAEFAGILEEKLKQLKAWSESCPENYLNRFALVSAEKARLDGRDQDAMRLYDQAIRSARENGFIQHEAIANELAAKFYLDRGFDTIASTYLRNARHGYFRWGALGKVKQLESRHGDIEERVPLGPTATIGTPMEQLDLRTVIKASQAVSGEIVLDTLIEKLLTIVLEQAGAGRGILILPRGDEHRMVAEAATEGEKFHVRLQDAPVTASQLPVSLFQYVVRARESVLLDDASAPNLYSDDEYVRIKRPKSVLCLPLVKQAKLVGVLYLENNLTPRAFTPDRIAVLDVLASQAAISLGMAGLYHSLRQENEERRRAQERFTKVFHASPAPMVVARVKDSVWVDINSSMLRMLGFSREEIVGRSTIEIGLLDMVDLDRIEKALREKGFLRDFEARIRTKSGETRITLSTIESIELDGEPCRISTSIDITDRKKAEEEKEGLMGQVKEERENLAAILHLMPVPMLLLEPGTAKVLFANKAAEALSGGTFPGCGATAPGTACTDSLGNPIAEDDMPDVRATRGERIRDFEMNWSAPSGKRTLIINSETLLDRQGKAEKVVVAFQDLTPLKKMEEQLWQSQKMEALGRLAGGIAHDFNNLLTAINGYSALAMQEVDRSHPLYGFLLEILKSGERAAGLTRQLLAYSRKQQLTPRLWSLNVIVSEMEGMLGRLIGEDIHLSTSLQGDTGLVKVDRGKVEQVLLNLVVNARDAMPKGGRLSLETANVDLGREYASSHPGVAPGPYVMLTVSDSGTGMTPKVKARLFEPFFTTKESGKGTGLGLSVVYGIVQQSGGSLSVYSEPGQGTTFRIYFPQAAEDYKAAPDAILPEKPEDLRGRETVLLAEDEESVRRFAANVLQAQGYTVWEAGNGREALDILERQGREVDMVLTDLIMPDMGGKELADRIKQSMPDLPVLFMSGYSEHAVLLNGLAEEPFLQKPFGPFDLAKKVRETLDHKPVARAIG